MMPIQKFGSVMTIAVVVVAALALGSARADAAVVTLTDGNSVASVDTDSQAGMFNWLIDGQDQMAQQWFWYRIGDGPEASINTISAAVNAGGGPFLSSTYTGNGFTINVRYLLTGGLPGSGASDIAETITINNLGQTALDFHFFQYSDFDLCNTIGGDTATFVNVNAVQQVDGACHLSETVITPSASHREAGIFPSTLVRLNDGLPTTLADNAGAGPGDATWAFQWDFILNPQGTFQISKDKRIGAVPEPASLLLLGSGLLGGLKAVRRRRKANTAI